MRWGTPASNQVDRVVQGNDQFGEGNGSAKFTEKQIEAIRLLRKSGMTYKAIADVVGCCKAYPWDICTGKARTRKTNRPPEKRIATYRKLGYRIEL